MPRLLFAVCSRAGGVNEVIAWDRGSVAGSDVGVGGQCTT